MTYMPNHVFSFAKPLIKIGGIWSNLWNLVEFGQICGIWSAKGIVMSHTQRHCDVTYIERKEEIAQASPRERPPLDQALYSAYVYFNKHTIALTLRNSSGTPWDWLTHPC